jgi:uncharacterized protein YbjQ (UPF0145 family)
MNRAAAYSRLLQEDPETAAFLRQAAEMFGKPAVIAIRFRNGERYIGGRFYDAQDCADFEMRLEASRRFLCPSPDDDDNE